MTLFRDVIAPLIKTCEVLAGNGEVLAGNDQTEAAAGGELSVLVFLRSPPDYTARRFIRPAGQCCFPDSFF